MFACALICEDLQTRLGKLWIANICWRGHRRYISVKAKTMTSAHISKINHIVIMKTTAVITVRDFNRMTWIIILVHFSPHRYLSDQLISLAVCTCGWLCLTTVAMGEMEKLRKEAESLKDQITVSIKNMLQNKMNT